MITDVSELPEPLCEGGYPTSQLAELFDEQQMSRLNMWMYGQTMMLCQGKAYNHEINEWYETCGGIAHGPVIYPHDLHRFIRGQAIID